MLEPAEFLAREQGRAQARKEGGVADAGGGTGGEEVDGSRVREAEAAAEAWASPGMSEAMSGAAAAPAVPSSPKSPKPPSIADGDTWAAAAEAAEGGSTEAPVLMDDPGGSPRRSVSISGSQPAMSPPILPATADAEVATEAEAEQRNQPTQAFHTSEASPWQWETDDGSRDGRMSEEVEVQTNDGTMLRYTHTYRLGYSYLAGRRAGSVVLLHGWSGSRRSFPQEVIDGLHAGGYSVFAPDLRFHGDSDKPGHGFHVARLAADLRALLASMDLERTVLVGCSMGAAVIWSYLELFGSERVGGCVFVDQAPLQDRCEGWEWGSKGIFDAKSLERVTASLNAGMAEFADGNAASCLTVPLMPAMLDILKGETLKCKPSQLAALMRDHTHQDWRPLLPHIDVPCLNLYGDRSGCFPVEGLQFLSNTIPNCSSVTFEGCNHWLYLEEPERFAREIVEWANSRVFVDV